MSIEKTTNREQKKRQTRQAFFNAVLDLCMSGQGYSSVSLRQVTREVGVVPTAFYRHFDDMESLGKALVEDELGGALATLREHMQLGRKRSFDRQIAKSVQLFFKAVDAQPRYWQFIASERFGGSEAVRRAINEQINTFAKIMSADLVLQPAFEHINSYDRYLLAETGVNLSFSWIIEWLDLTHMPIFLDEEERLSTCELDTKKQQMLHRCTRQMQMVLYGAYNWKSSEETLLDEPANI
ncbi:TetR family transcriptional regulator [Moraxella catarrhalis]|uniref:TetR family transcriptional regulator n=1 Tax=Moraxella catarrhalis TaxID=480 RepID=UPI000202A7F5|nr:TetR family transcriptional regulator [Moraxella catarrhalis]EGE11963.1 TetR family transcription regulator [Moraxella catarrhalis 103P14B1]EGE23440.1 TetR family transcription regulator [Moraxella catarrhalis 101P30B1]MPX17624.1 TetR family transcriptional regulator [Moraxella catarrhalis]MPX34432.1 TetR family transcriptional regulator [Moraxella catarrhalis]MPX48833.1 TetR family transcriptional regulator [Moraxella catarrhalis]